MNNKETERFFLSGMSGPPEDRPAVNLPSADNRFEFGPVIGRGRYGTVFRSHDSYSNLDVALKVPSLDRRTRKVSVAAIKSEYRFYNSLHNKDIAPKCFGLVDISFPEGRFPVLVLECFSQGNFRNFLTSLSLDIQIRLSQMALLVRSLIEVIGALHREGHVHGDLRFENLLVDGDSLKPCDFGATVPTNEPTSPASDFAPPAEYSSPEQLSGRPISPATDIYAIGTMLYELLSPNLSHPFSGNKLEISHGHLNRPFPLLKWAGSEVNSVLRRCTAKSPEDRYSSCDELLAAVDAFLPSTKPKKSKTPRREKGRSVAVRRQPRTMQLSVRNGSELEAHGAEIVRLIRIEAWEAAYKHSVNVLDRVPWEPRISAVAELLAHALLELQTRINRSRGANGYLSAYNRFMEDVGHDLGEYAVEVLGHAPNNN